MNTIKELYVNKKLLILLTLPEFIMQPTHQTCPLQPNELNLKIDTKYKKYIDNFLKTTENEFSFSNINHTLNTLSIKPLSRKKEALGIYDIEKNNIRVSKKSELAIYHELFHACTRFITPISIGCGFYRSLSIVDSNIGDGLDEGYTDLLSKRYFDNGISEPFTSNIALKLEMILGESKMRKLYDHNDLHEVMKILTSLSSSEEAKKFILGLDTLYFYLENQKRGVTLWSTLSAYLTDIHLNNLIETYKQEGLSLGEINNKLTEFKQNFTKHTLNNKKVKKYYLKSNDYKDITSNLTYTEFTKRLHR